LASSSRAAASPLGPAVAAAEAEGYNGSDKGPLSRLHLQIAQGSWSRRAGRGESYLDNGKLARGFALLAYPANYGVSGIMTFMVNQDGTIYQNDFGDNTANAVSKRTTYNPDQSWTPVE